jgi:hypothetical protein
MTRRVSANSRIMYLVILAYLERITVFFVTAWTLFKAALRTALGPAPTNYHLLADGRILSTQMPLPAAAVDSTLLFDVQSNHITSMAHPAPDGRFRRLPFVSLRVEHDSVGVIDMSDWVGELRANPVPAPDVLDAKKLIQLWSHVHNRYVPLRGARVVSTGSDGEETTTVLD